MMKYLPKQEGEEGEPLFPIVWAVNKQHPTKVIFLAVVSCPIEGKNFNGKIYLKRVSDTEIYKRKTLCEKFSHQISVNKIVKNEWHKCIDKEMTCEVMRYEIGEILIWKMI